MKNLFFFALLFILSITISTAQNQKINYSEFEARGNKELTQVKVPITKSDLKDSIKPIFYTLIGQNANSLNSEISTSFDKDKTTVKVDFTFSPFKENKSEKTIREGENQKLILKGKLEVGESTNIFDFGNSDMPIVKLGLDLNFLFKKDDYFAVNKSERGITFTRLNYFTAGFDYNNAQYKIVDVSKAFNDQIFKENFSSWKGGLGYNFYAKWNKETYNFKGRPDFFYFNLFYTYERGNNINKFEQVDVKDYITIPDSSTNREVSKSTKAFRGNYKEFTQHTVSSEILIGVGDIVVLDLFGDVQISELKDPLYSYGLGLFFNAKKDNKDKVNLGVFMKWIGNSEPFIGLKTELPIKL